MCVYCIHQYKVCLLTPLLSEGIGLVDITLKYRSAKAAKLEKHWFGRQEGMEFNWMSTAVEKGEAGSICPSFEAKPMVGTCRARRANADVVVRGKGLIRESKAVSRC